MQTKTLEFAGVIATLVLGACPHSSLQPMLLQREPKTEFPDRYKRSLQGRQ